MMVAVVVDITATIPHYVGSTTEKDAHMATTFTTQFDEVVAVRSATRGGSVVQFEVTETEFANWADVVCFGDDGSTMTARDVAATATFEVRFDNAAWRNDRAREFEKGSRFTEFNEWFFAAADDERRRARECARQSFRTV
jgi:hypothetical protein